MPITVHQTNRILTPSAQIRLKQYGKWELIISNWGPLLADQDQDPLAHDNLPKQVTQVAETSGLVINYNWNSNRKDKDLATTPLDLYVTPSGREWPNHFHSYSYKRFAWICTHYTSKTLVNLHFPNCQYGMASKYTIQTWKYLIGWL